MNPRVLVASVLAMAALAILVGAGLLGYAQRAAMCGEQLAKIEATQAQRERAVAQRVVDEFQRIQRIDDEVERAWIKTQQQIEERHAKAQPKLARTFPAHQRADGACNLTRGTVGLLNDTARGDEPGTEAAGLPPGQAQAPSDVTESAALEHCRIWAEQYEHVAGQLTQLIDWTERSAHVAGQE